MCFPNVLQGLISVDTETKFWGSEINARKNICCGCDYRVDMLGGYRYMQLEDRVNITENLTVTETAGPVPFGTNFLVTDRFYSKNQFNGGQLGLDAEVRRGRFYVNARGTVALGATSLRSRHRRRHDLDDPRPGAGVHARRPARPADQHRPICVQ